MPDAKAETLGARAGNDGDQAVAVADIQRYFVIDRAGFDAADGAGDGVARRDLGCDEDEQIETEYGRRHHHRQGEERVEQFAPGQMAAAFLLRLVSPIPAGAYRRLPHPFYKIMAAIQTASSTFLHHKSALTWSYQQNCLDRQRSNR